MHQLTPTGSLLATNTGSVISPRIEHARLFISNAPRRFAGVDEARDEGLVYEEALLLRTEADLVTAGDGIKKLEEADRLLQQLGVITTG